MSNNNPEKDKKMIELTEQQKEDLERTIDDHENKVYDTLHSLADDLGKILKMNCEFITDKSCGEIAKVFRSITTEIDFVSDELGAVREVVDREEVYDIYDPYLDGWAQNQTLWVYISDDEDKKKKLGDKRLFIGGKEEK